MAASDILTFEGEHHLVLVDYHSKQYIELTKLKYLANQETIEALKEHFCRHGIPAIDWSLVGVSSREFEYFAKGYKCEHLLVSQKHSLANGEFEATVKTAKSLWRKSKDKNKALLEYRATPIPGINLPPSQLSMRCRLRLTVAWPTGAESLQCQR